MRYMIKSGILSDLDNEKKQAQITNIWGGAKKNIILYASDFRYQTDIEKLDTPPERMGDVRYRMYTLKNCDSTILMEARPDYAKDDNPDEIGWPICRAPKVDHANILIGKITYLLTMHNVQNYSLQDNNGTVVLQITHNGLLGGWTLNSTEYFSPQILCGIFIFCRYIEQENEFMIV